MIITLNDLGTKYKHYGLLYSDPPWPCGKGNIRKSRKNQTKDMGYSLMSYEEIEIFHRNLLMESVLKDEHNVFMWAIDRSLFEAEDMMRRLGYALHARFIWNKENGIAPAFTVRFTHEYLLWFYKKGKMLKPSIETRGKYPTVFIEKAKAHSRKPDCVYNMFEDMFPDVPKLEVFARRETPGFDSFGNEVGTVN